MSYLNQAHDPRRRATALTATVAVHAALALGVVTGLTVTGYAPIDTYDPIVQFPTAPPPEPKPTETPEPQQTVIPYVAPPPQPPLKLTQDPPPPLKADEPREIVTSLYPTGETVLPPAPPPAPGLTPKRAVPRNNTSSWITNDDYPRRPLVDRIEGSVGYRLVIGTTGRVSSCELTRPSGNSALDDATCRLITSRARFEPATDEAGAKVLGTFTGSVHWQIPD